jgi:nucleoside-diphosphate-sugar epimerase
MKKILITGGAGYVGTELCNYLAKKNYDITAVDTFWFEDKLDANVKKIKSDIRNLDIKIFKKIDCVIHLAYLSCDNSCEINAKETWEIGPLSLYSMLEGCVKYKVKKFIFASSGSIYGLKNENKVTEELGLEPLTDYNKSKMICEKVLNSYSKKIKTVVLRPGTVCGFSKRLRLDLLVNIFAYQAYFNKKINVNGGKQIRPIINIKDLVNAYEFFVKKNITGTFNVSYANKSVLEIAKMVSKIIPAKILLKRTLDPRSYRMDNSKLKKTGLNLNYNIESAIYELKKLFIKGFKPSEKNWNIKWLLKNNFVDKN